MTVGYTTADGTALAGTDYTAEAGTVTIPAGAASATIAIPVLGNLLLQPDRTFSVTLTGVVGVSSASAGFGVQQPFSSDFGPFSVAVGDFNGDGKPDLAVANDNANTVSVLLNTTAPERRRPALPPLRTLPRPRALSPSWSGISTRTTSPTWQSSSRTRASFRYC